MLPIVELVAGAAQGFREARGFRGGLRRVIRGGVLRERDDLLNQRLEADVRGDVTSDLLRFGRPAASLLVGSRTLLLDYGVDYRSGPARRGERARLAARFFPEDGPPVHVRAAAPGAFLLERRGRVSFQFELGLVSKDSKRQSA